jgi:predicted peptidase
MRIGLVFTLTALSASFCVAETGFLDRSITFGGQSYRYQVYVPADYTPTKVWPVIVYLHGNGRQGDDGLLQTVTGIADQIRQHRLRYPLIAVIPQAATGTFWPNPEMEELVIAELDRTVEEFHGDSTRLYLGGYSMGGVGAYRIAYHWPDKFAAMFTIAGSVESGTVAVIPKAAIEIDHRANAFTTVSDPFAVLASKISALPIRLYHGDADMTVLVEQSRRLSEALRKLGANFKYTEYPGTDHTQVHSKALAEPDLIEWLLAQHR